MSRSRRANEIDMLRFFAAMAVVMYHYLHLAAKDSGGRALYPVLSELAQYGYLGVNLFFMISGFVVLMSANQGSLRSFVASRAARLYPALWICCTVTFLVLAATGDWRGLGNYFGNMSLVGMLGNIELMDGSYWSLLYELRFYMLVALVLAVGQIKRAEQLLFFWLVAVLAIKIFPALSFASVVVMPDYAAYFVAGGLLYFVWDEGLTWQRAVLLGVCLALAERGAMTWAAYLVVRDGVRYEALLVAAGVAACFLVLLTIALRKTGPLARADFTKLGALTYPLYLLHQNVGIAIFRSLGGMVNPHVLMWGTVGLMIAGAWVVNTQFESRICGALRRRLEKGSTHIVGTACEEKA